MYIAGLRAGWGASGRETAVQAAVDPAELKHKDTKPVVLRPWVTAEQHATQHRVVPESEEGRVARRRSVSSVVPHRQSSIILWTASTRRQPPPVISLTNSSNFHL